MAGRPSENLSNFRSDLATVTPPGPRESARLRQGAARGNSPLPLQESSTRSIEGSWTGGRKQVDLLITSGNCRSLGWRMHETRGSHGSPCADPLIFPRTSAVDRWMGSPLSKTFPKELQLMDMHGLGNLRGT